MHYKITITKTASKDIKKLTPQIQKRLKAKLEWFVTREDPLEFAEPLTKPADAQYRFRIGTYRVLFDIEAKNIVVLHIQHRREVYRR